MPQQAEHHHFDVDHRAWRRRRTCDWISYAAGITALAAGLGLLAIVPAALRSSGTGASESSDASDALGQYVVPLAVATCALGCIALALVTVRIWRRPRLAHVQVIVTPGAKGNSSKDVAIQVHFCDGRIARYPPKWTSAPSPRARVASDVPVVRIERRGSGAVLLSSPGRPVVLDLRDADGFVRLVQSCGLAVIGAEPAPQMQVPGVAAYPAPPSPTLVVFPLHTLMPAHDERDRKTFRELIAGSSAAVTPTHFRAGGAVSRGEPSLSVSSEFDDFDVVAAV